MIFHKMFAAIIFVSTLQILTIRVSALSITLSTLGMLTAKPNAAGDPATTDRTKMNWRCQSKELAFEVNVNTLERRVNLLFPAYKSANI